MLLQSSRSEVLAMHRMAVYVIPAGMPDRAWHRCLQCLCRIAADCIELRSFFLSA